MKIIRLMAAAMLALMAMPLSATPVQVTSTSAVVWFDDFAKAKDQAAKSHQFLLAFFYDPTSALSKKMIADVLDSDAVIQGMRSLVKAKLPNTGPGTVNGSWAAQLKIETFPCAIFFDDQGAELDRFAGYQDLATFLRNAAQAIDPKTNYVNLKERLKNNPQDVEALYYMGCKYWRRGDEAKAEDYFTQVRQFDPNDQHHFAGNLLLRQVEQLQRQLQFAKALELLQGFEQKYPQSDELDTAAYLHARLLWLTGKTEEALTAYRDFCKRFPSSDYEPQAVDALKALAPASQPN